MKAETPMGCSGGKVYEDVRVLYCVLMLTQRESTPQDQEFHRWASTLFATCAPKSYQTSKT